MDKKSFRSFNLDSIRARYVLGAFLLSFIFVVSVWLTHVFISGAISQTAQSTQHRNDLIESHRRIREHLWKAEFAMQTYLVTPEPREYDTVIENMNAAIRCVAEITDNDWTQSSGIMQLVFVLSDDLKQLKTNAIMLLDIRDQAEKLFPAYVTINEVMLPVNLHVISQLELATEDLSSRLAENNVRKTDRLFGEFKDEWLNMVGAFRMYIASRAMSIRDSANASQQYGMIIDIHHSNLINQRDLLEKPIVAV